MRKPEEIRKLIKALSELKKEEEVKVLLWVLETSEEAFENVLELDEKTKTTEETFELKEGNSEYFSISPNSTSYKAGHDIFNSPFMLQMTDYDLKESVAMSMSLDKAKELKDFLEKRIHELEG